MLSDYEVLTTKYICERYGYGHIMELASALWREHLTDEGLPPAAAFVPTITDFIKEDCRFPEQQKIYDELLKEWEKKQNGRK